MKFADYRTIIFDCDGVILDSNRLKTDAFYTAALPYGTAAAKALRAYHLERGGISRYQKFDYFFNQIVLDSAPGPSKEELLESYAEIIQDALSTCPIAEGLELLRDLSRNSRWLVASGGDQSELRQLFSTRGLEAFFDGGIFGSPTTKDEILVKELESSNIKHPCLFLGDSEYDHKAAERAGLDFIFVNAWSEMPNWRDYVRIHNLDSVPSISHLASMPLSTE